jgi:hypothetical protein
LFEIRVLRNLTLASLDVLTPFASSVLARFKTWVMAANMDFSLTKRRVQNDKPQSRHRHLRVLFYLP